MRHLTGSTDDDQMMPEQDSATDEQTPRTGMTSWLRDLFDTKTGSDTSDDDELLLL